MTYNFNEKTPNPDDPKDYHACHFFFAANTVSTSSGNSLAFQYINNPTKDAITWAAKGSFITPPDNTGVTTTTTSMPTTTTSLKTTTSNTTSQDKPTTTLISTTTAPGQSAITGGSSSPDTTLIPQPSGLSGGAIAGIVIGILALIGIIAGVAFFFGRRVRKNRSEEAKLLPPRDESNLQPMYKTDQTSSMEQVPPWTGKRPGQQVRMGELHAGDQAVASELDTRAVVHELGDGHRNELP